MRYKPETWKGVMLFNSTFFQKNGIHNLHKLLIAHPFMGRKHLLLNNTFNYC